MNKLIPANADFKQVANDIVSNMDKWLIDRDEKTRKISEVINEHFAEQDRLAAARNKVVADNRGKNSIDDGNRGYGQGRKMGD